MKKIIVIFALTLLPLFAQAASESSNSSMFEVKGSAGLSFINPTSLNDSLSGNGITNMFLIGIYAVDAVIKFPGGLGIGARYDWQGLRVGNIGDNNSFEISCKRLAGVLQFRFVDKLGYFGFIGTAGVSHTPAITYVVNGSSSEYNSGSGRSFSYAVEGGFNFRGGFKLGIEGGFQEYYVKEITGPSGNAPFNINFNGPYAVLRLGFGI